MLLPLKVNPQQKMTLQSQIFDQIRRMILDGRLRSGDFLPTTRTLSEQVGISRNTIVLAYERLIAEGYIQTRPYVGTFVSAEIPDTAFATSTDDVATLPRSEDRSCLDEFAALRLDGMRSQLVVNPHAERLAANFWVGRPASDSFPVKAWSNVVWKRLQSAGSSITQYQDPAGLVELRQAIADYLGPTRGLTAEPDQIIIVGGTQDGLNLVARLLVEQGSTVVVESPCYQGAAYVFESFGADLYPVPVDADGINTARLPDMPNPVAYVTPSHQYPLGVTLSLERRIALLTWASERQGYIVEDDYDSDFRFVGSPLTALKGIDRNERVFYLGTFSKCMGPALRLGFVVVPRAFAKAARTLKALMNNGQSWLEQAAMADFMTSGAYGRHLRRVRQLYLSRRNATLQALQRPDEALAEILRVGRTGIVTFPNFGHWRVRLALARGRMPVTPSLPSRWYDTPNIHLCTVDDFEALCAARRWKIVDRRLLNQSHREGPAHRLAPNLFTEVAMYLLEAPERAKLDAS